MQTLGGRYFFLLDDAEAPVQISQDVADALRTAYFYDELPLNAPSPGQLGFAPLPQSAKHNGKIDRVCFPTGNRSHLIERTLDSYIRNFEHFGHAPEIVIYDDSSSDEERNKYLEIVDAKQKKTSLPLRLVNRLHRKKAGKVLAESFPSEMIAFAFLGKHQGISYGAGRNVVLLDGVGKSLLCLDDDSVCNTARPQQYDLQTLRLSSPEPLGYRNYDPQTYWFDTARARIESRIERQDVDILAEHAQFLGAPTNELLSRHKRSADNQILSPRFFVDGTQRPVAVTFGGMWGDCGWYAPTWYMFKNKQSLANLSPSDEQYRANKCSREIARSVIEPTLCDGRYCQGAVMGLYNETELPPFMPVMRYEDGVFRLTTNLTAPGAGFVHIPAMVEHAPSYDRKYDEKSIWQTAGWLRFNELVNQFLLSWRPLAYRDTHAAMLRELGRYLQEVAHLPSREFWDFARWLVLKQKSRYIEFVFALADERADHTAYAADLRKHGELVVSSIERPEYFVPKDIVDVFGDDAKDTTQYFLMLYGQLLEHWHDLRRAVCSNEWYFREK